MKHMHNFSPNQQHQSTEKIAKFNIGNAKHVIHHKDVKPMIAASQQTTIWNTQSMLHVPYTKTAKINYEL